MNRIIILLGLSLFLASCAPNTHKATTFSVPKESSEILVADLASTGIAEQLFLQAFDKTSRYFPREVSMEDGYFEVLGTRASWQDMARHLVSDTFLDWKDPLNRKIQGVYVKALMEALADNFHAYKPSTGSVGDRAVERMFGGSKELTADQLAVYDAWFGTRMLNNVARHLGIENRPEFYVIGANF